MYGKISGAPYEPMHMISYSVGNSALRDFEARFRVLLFENRMHNFDPSVSAPCFIVQT